jgi:transposase
MTAMKHSREELMDRVLTLYWKGLSCRVIARELGVGYHAVRRQLAAYTGAGHPRAHPPLVSAPTTSSPDEDTTT